VNPYLRPLYDALHDMMDLDKAQALIQRGSIEVRRWPSCAGARSTTRFVILDEAQNTTAEQMKMFLTRLGYDSQGGDHGRRHPGGPPRGRKSGPARRDSPARRGGGHRVRPNFTDVDVVRHPLVRASCAPTTRATRP
jgi:phosphate starvation-inducible PhoH-like protein